MLCKRTQIGTIAVTEIKDDNNAFISFRIEAMIWFYIAVYLDLESITTSHYVRTILPRIGKGPRACGYGGIDTCYTTRASAVDKTANDHSDGQNLT